MELEKKVTALHAALKAMSDQQDAMAAELAGMKKAVSVMAGLVPATTTDVQAAWETAVALVGIATERGEISPDMQSIEIETIREVLAQMGQARRTEQPRPPT